MAKVRWGVIGSGGIARRRTIPEGIVPAANAELAAVYGPVREENEAVGREFGARPVRSVEALLGADVEAVYVASPVQFHLEQISAALRAGKHVLAEKPLGRNVLEARQVVTQAQQGGLKLGCGLMMRFSRQHQAALRLIEAGRLGQPVYGRAQLTCWYPPMAGAWRQEVDLGGGGALMDMGGHCIDLLEMFFGKAEKVSCFVRGTVHGYGVEDSATAMLWFENGALGVVEAFWNVPDASGGSRLELYGSQGSIMASGTMGQQAGGEMVATLEEAGKAYAAAQEQRRGAGEVIEPEAVNTYRAEIEDFSGAILEGREPAVSGAVGLRNQEVLAACYESSRLGKVVAVGTTRGR